MLRLVVLLLLCIAATYTPGRCETGAPRDAGHAELPEFLSELDLSSLEASEEDVEALKKIVKRLAPEKNGEYQVYQGVTGQPGVDYPALTSIPATSFSCRGLRGGYYADLETNCQVFHICDNGRKISFLCPNGTIFQQSQLICDWWFKVDCSKSTELYEQSAEQLAEEERKRADARKMNSEFHRTVEPDSANYYENADYDGKQNARTNPYGQSAKQNQIPEKQEEPKGAQHFGPNNVFDNGRESGRYFPESNVLRGNEKTTTLPSDSFNQPPKQRHYHDGGSNYQAINRQRNQLVTEPQSGKFNYESKDSRQNYQSAFGSGAVADYRFNQNTARNEKPEFRSSKSRTSTRNNLLHGPNQSQKTTPTYMETTTFRTTTAPPPREFQQFAESAAFVSNRGNRFHSKPEGGRQFYYHSYDQRDYTTVDDRERETTTTLAPDVEATVSFTPKTGAPPFPGPTFAPIYKPRTTTIPPYETTLQYTPTTETPFYSTSFYRPEDTAETTYTPAETATTVTASTSEEYRTTQPYLSTPAAIGRVPPAANYQSHQHADSRVTSRDTDRDTASFATTRPYVNTESYRPTAFNVTQSAVNQNAFPTSTSYFEDTRGQTGTTRADYQTGNSIAENAEIKGTTRDPSRSSSHNFRQNSISSTEKPWRSTNVYQQSGSTSKTLSPYDTSFTYKQGKVLSTLGPYVPFTKNYVYSTMTTTSKPPVTASTYSPTLANYRLTTSNLIPKVRTATSRPKDRATYLPESSSKRPTTLNDRPYAEREHALSMLHSLQGLENNVNGLSESGGRTGGGSGRNIPLAPGSSTLHSLALYFATASDNFDSNETAESAASAEEQQEGGESASVELPTSILTHHTISSYVDLFNLNNALEGNTTVTELAAESEDGNSDSEHNDEASDDLEIEQSEDPLSGAKKSNTTQLRELAQVFTHALSAYLQDPNTFKKVLTEIRPTEPSPTTVDSDQFEATTLYPTTAEEYSSVTKEKDEVLDFSDDSDPTRRRKLTTTFPTTLQPPAATSDRPYSTYHTTPYDDYYSTPLSQTRRPLYYPSTTLLPPGISSLDSGDYVESSTQITGGNTFAFEVNRAFSTTTANYVRNYDDDAKYSTDLSPIYDNYFPLDDDGNRNRIGGFHNNTSRTFQPYGKNVKPSDATPISNYVASSTMASFNHPVVGSTTPSWGKGSAGDRPVQNLTPPHYQRFGNVKSFEVSNSIVPSQPLRSTTPLPRSKPTYETASSTVHPFRIRYYESTTLPPEDRRTSPESLVTARSSYVKFRNSYNRIEGTQTRRPTENAATTVATTRDTIGTLDPITATIGNVDVTPYTATVARATSVKPANASSSKQSSPLSNDHWTSSPMVTQLWETTVFVDPQRINHGLESNDGASTQPPVTDSGESAYGELTVAASTARPPTLSTEDQEETTVTRIITSTPSPWQWAPNDNNSPVAFTLLPTTFTAENTATPTPIITTRSSITTTITSSVTTDSLSRDKLTTLLPVTVTANVWNTTENEVLKAQEMFGKLNETSTNTLMRVMKQADNNETVRQLVLLLISHCNGPRNKTAEHEKDQLLDALLRMPVNEFSSEESREIVAGINRLHLSTGKARSAALPSSTAKTPRQSSVRPTPSQPSITTFRSRTGRRFRTTTETTNGFARRLDEDVSADANNSLSTDETTASDNRALELLRSLYTVAAKWG